MTNGDGGGELRGILYMCLATLLLFPLYNAATKYLAADYGTLQIIWIRAIGHMLCMLILFAPGYGLRALFRTNRPGLQLLRSGLQLGATACFVKALAYIPLALATAVNFTAPFIVVVLSIVFLGEQVGIRRWAAVMVGFAGTVLILRPGGEGSHWAAFLVLGSAGGYAVFQVLTRKLAAHDDTRTTAAYTILVALVVTSAFAPFDAIAPKSPADWLVFAALGVFGGLSHYFIIKAYETGSASVIAPFDYGQLIGATVLGYLLFGNFPDLWTWAGAAVIIASGLYIAHREALRRR